MKRTTFALLALWALFFITRPLLARPAGNVGVVTFTADFENDAVTLFWLTATELHSAGFHLDRTTDGASAVRLTTTPIPAAGNPTAGASYTVVDDGIVPENTYTYHLIEVGIDGSERTIKTLEIDVQQESDPIAMLPPALPSPSDPRGGAPNEQVVDKAQPTAVPLAKQRPTRSALTVVTNDDDERETVVDNTSSQSDSPTPLQQETPDNGYPDPDPPTPTGDAEAYVPQPTNTPLIPTETPQGTPYVPSPTRTPIGTGALNGDSIEPNDNISTLGGGSLNESEIEQAPQLQPVLPPTQGRLFLWLGFIGALIVFCAAVLITTLIFSRRTQ